MNGTGPGGRRGPRSAVRKGAVVAVWLPSLLPLVTAAAPPDSGRPRAREIGIAIGALPTGPLNAITDVPGVRVGHATLVAGDSVRTGVTVVLPHPGNWFQEKVPGAVHAFNAFGKLVGSTQVQELGTIESPIALTSTLSVWKVADALAGCVLDLPGNEAVRSVNVLVGETNDGRLNDVRGRHVGVDQVRAAIAAAAPGPVAEGSVGAGTGTVCFGWKGGIGTASRRVGNHTLGVIVQTNFGGSLTVGGVAVHARLAPGPARGVPGGGSCMIVLAADAPVDGRNLERLARRAIAGMGRAGASFANGSGDYAIAFSTAASLRVPHAAAPATPAATLSPEALNPYFVAAADATEEAILNSLLRATPVTSRFGAAEAIPIEALKRALAGAADPGPRRK